MCAYIEEYRAQSKPSGASVIQTSTRGFPRPHAEVEWVASSPLEPPAAPRDEGAARGRKEQGGETRAPLEGEEVVWG